jgi:two-component system sensor kinase FixL
MSIGKKLTRSFALIFMIVLVMAGILFWSLRRSDWQNDGVRLSMSQVVSLHRFDRLLNREMERVSEIVLLGDSEEPGEMEANKLRSLEALTGVERTFDEYLAFASEEEDEVALEELGLSLIVASYLRVSEEVDAVLKLQRAGRRLEARARFENVVVPELEDSLSPMLDEVIMDEQEEMVGIHAQSRELSRFIRVLSWFIVALSMVLVAVVSLVITRTIANPLKRLNAAAFDIGSGRLYTRVAVDSDDEIGQLAGTFNRMTEDLEKTMVSRDLLAREVAERRRTDRALKDSEEMFRSMSEAAFDAVIMIDDKGMVKFWNRAAERIFGYTAAEIVGSEMIELIAPAHLREEHRRGMAEPAFMERGEGSIIGKVREFEAMRKDSTVFPMELSVSTVRLNGRWNAIGMVRDITARKREEAERRQLELKLMESAKMVSLGELGAGVAHELNSPLAGILSLTELMIRRAPEGPPNIMYLDKIKDAAVRSGDIIRDLLTFAKDAGVDTAPVSFNEIIKSVMSLMVAEVKFGSLAVSYALDPELPQVLANKGQMVGVALNLIKNARDAMSGNGDIRISTRVVSVDGRRMGVLEVADTGPGIPEEIRDRIYDPFFSTKEKGGRLNVGLGLSICRSIVELHGGALEMETAIGEGTLFKVLIPVAEESVEQASA